MKGLVIIPTYNERENIEKLLKILIDIDKNIPDTKIDILVVDDNSPDGTWEVVEEFSRHTEKVKLIKRPSKLGLGTAYKVGFKYAIENNYDFVVQMDADFSHNPFDIPKMVSLLQKSDFVVGSRYLNGVSVINWPIRRLILSYLANLYARKLTGVPVKDLTSGFTCIKTKVLKKMDIEKLKSDGYGFQIELKTYANYCDNSRFILTEMPIIFEERRGGKSKMSKRIIVEAFFLVIKLFFKRFFKHECLENFRRF